MSSKSSNAKQKIPQAQTLKERAAHARDAAGRFIRRAADQPQPTPTPEASAKPRGSVPAPLNAHSGAYGLRVDEDGLGLHAVPGSSIVVEPVMPTGAGLAVIYVRDADAPGPMVFDLTHNFDPEHAGPVAPGSEVVPRIEVTIPSTGRVGLLGADRIEKIHRVISVHTPPEIAAKHLPAPTPLPVMNACPEGMGEHYVKQAAAYPLIRPGETVVYDPTRREPTHGALCVIQWREGSRGILLTNLRKLGGQGEPTWFVDPVNRPSNGEMLKRFRERRPPGAMLYASDGPYEVEHLREKIVGTVVGVLVPGYRESEPPAAEPKASANPEPDTVAEIYAAATKVRAEAAAAAIDDADLTSAVSVEVRTAIETHRDVLAATEDAPCPDDETFDRHSAAQIDAEYAVAHAPARSLADLRAKLTYLIPIIAPDMLDRTHVEHLEAIRADVDWMCREPALLDGQPGLDPLFAAIEAHAAARRALETTSIATDTVARREQGLSTSAEAMKSVDAAHEAANAVEIEAWNAVFRTRPTTVAGLLAAVRHAQEWAPECCAPDGSIDVDDIFGGIALDIQGLMQEAPPAGDETIETDDDAQARIATTHFTPTDFSSPCPVPSLEDWEHDGKATLPWLRIGFLILSFDRDTLVAHVADESEEQFKAFNEALGRAERNFAQLHRFVQAVQARRMIGLAILAENERQAASG